MQEKKKFVKTIFLNSWHLDSKLEWWWNSLSLIIGWSGNRKTIEWRKEEKMKIGTDWEHLLLKQIKENQEKRNAFHL